MIQVFYCRWNSYFSSIQALCPMWKTIAAVVFLLYGPFNSHCDFYQVFNIVMLFNSYLLQQYSSYFYTFVYRFILVFIKHDVNIWLIIQLEVRDTLNVRRIERIQQCFKLSHIRLYITSQIVFSNLCFHLVPRVYHYQL